MNDLIRHIEYLASRKDCVIIPGFGAILTQSYEARIDSESGSIYPPRRVFSYNSDLAGNNDGTLACSLARATGMAYEEANDTIAERVEAMVRQLRMQGELTLGRIGTFTYDAETQTTHFTHFEVDRLSVATAWLPMVQRRAQSEAETEDAYEAPVRPSPFVRFAKVAASIAVLICICFIASTPVSVDDVALASLSPEFKPVEIAEMLPSTPPQAEANLVATTALSSDLYIDVDTAERNGYARSRVQADPDGRYVIIIGSFASRADADKFISYTDPNAQVLEKDGRCRVYCAAYQTETEAYQALRQFSDKHQSAWVCKR